MNENKHTNTDLEYKYSTHLPITFFCGIEMLEESVTKQP
jgi:hypothetical protein